MEDASQVDSFVDFARKHLAIPSLVQPIFHLQHQSGFNINVLLYLLWIAKRQRGRLTKQHIKVLQGEITVWHQRVITELKYTYALLVDQNEPVAISIREALEEEIGKAYVIEQQMLSESKIKNQMLRRTPNQQLADACASIVHYCELKNDLMSKADGAAFIQLFSAVFDDAKSEEIEKHVAQISDQFAFPQSQPAQQVLWQEV